MTYTHLTRSEGDENSPIHRAKEMLANKSGVSVILLRTLR